VAKVFDGEEFEFEVRSENFENCFFQLHIRILCSPKPLVEFYKKSPKLEDHAPLTEKLKFNIF